jgi:hypothetical protein
MRRPEPGIESSFQASDCVQIRPDPACENIEEGHVTHTRGTRDGADAAITNRSTNVENELPSDFAERVR